MSLTINHTTPADGTFSATGAAAWDAAHALTGTVDIANGGTGQITQQAALNALAGTTTSGQYLRGNGTNVAMSAIQAADVPTLNQNTTGTAANVTGTVAISNGGTGQTTQTAAFDALAPTTTKGDLIAYDGTDNVRVAAGTNGYALTANSTASAGVAWAQFSANIQDFTSVGTSTWTKPAGAKLVYVLAFSGGGGGGGGSKAAVASTSYNRGGPGGTAGTRIEAWFPASVFGATESVVIGAGGTGGAGATTNGTSGSNAGAAGASSFGSLVYAQPSSVSAGGSITVVSGAGQTGGAAVIISAFISGSSTTAVNPGLGGSNTSNQIPTAATKGGFNGGGGGGGGGTNNTNNGGFSGASGGLGGAAISSSNSNTTTGSGGSGGAVNTNGSNGADATDDFVGGSGGGGGGAGTTANAGAGGNGGYPGGGGGGGGGAISSFNGGAGGNGGNGFIRVVTFF